MANARGRVQEVLAMRTLLSVSISLLFATAGAARAADPIPTAQPEGGTCAPLRVHFAFDSAELSPDAELLLNRSADCLKTNQRLKVSVQGNADERGSSEYNLQLGERRARSVEDYLASRGVSQAQLSTVSFGEDNPLCRGSDEDCWKHNRRAAIEPACRL
jgi:peptidoglycan-associated lipoprotein